MGELALILYAITKVEGRVPDWGRKVIANSWLQCAQLTQTAAITTLWESIYANRNNVEILQLFLHLELLYGLPLPFHDQIQQFLLRLKQEGTALPTAIAYTCELAKAGTTKPDSIRELNLLLEQVEEGEKLYTSDWYNLTHSLLYTTHFGQRELPDQIGKNAISNLLKTGLKSTITSRHLDLVAEFITCFCYLKPPPALLQPGLNLLLQNIQNDSSAPLILGNQYAKKSNYFAQHYHLVLTTLLAITTYKQYAHAYIQRQAAH